MPKPSVKVKLYPKQPSTPPLRHHFVNQRIAVPKAKVGKGNAVQKGGSKSSTDDAPTDITRVRRAEGGGRYEWAAVL